MNKVSVFPKAFDTWRDASQRFVIGKGGEFKALGDGHFELFSGIPIADLNGYIVQNLKPNISLISSAAQLFAPSSAPWSITIRGFEVPLLLEKIAADYGLTKRKHRPLMVADLEKCNPPPQSDGLPVLRSLGAVDQDRYIDALSIGFEGPREILSAFGSIFDIPGATAYAIEDDGRLVSTGLIFGCGEWVALFNISTDPSYRGRGLARKVIRGMLSDAAATGARYAVLQSAETAIPLYESVGFVVSENLLTLSPGE